MRLLLIALFVSFSASAATIDLQSGEARYVGGDLVRCDAGGTTTTPTTDPWQVVHERCECAGGNFPDVKLITEYANGETRSKKLSGPHNGDYLCERALQADSRCR